MKPKVAVYDFTGCEGCELQILNCEEHLLDIVGSIELVYWREAMTPSADAPNRYDGSAAVEADIALVDGGITTPHGVERIKEIRRKSNILVACGSCACYGGINALKNDFPMEEVKRIVYGDMARHFETIPAQPMSNFVKVDFMLPGCPMVKDEFLTFFKSLLLGKTKWQLPEYPVCVECKRKENVCVFDKGLTCLGPITIAGCGANCPSYGSACEGCRGLVPNPNINAALDVLTEYGLELEDAVKQMKMFCNALEPVSRLDVWTKTE